jgi:hypothetical protein
MIQLNYRKFIGTGDSLLKIFRTTYPPYECDDWEQNFSFGKGNNPFKGINIALMEFVPGCMIWDNEYQNLYATTTFSGLYLSADVVYEFNKDNYPIKADIKYSNSSTHLYYYLEYESY